MKVKVTYLLSDNEGVQTYNVNENEFNLGDIVVVEDELNPKTKYGVITKINSNTRRQIQNKKLTLASELDRVLFWLDFENKLLHNKVKLSEHSLKEYRNVKGNATLSDTELNNKITRNLICAYKGNSVKVTERGNIILCYGYLRMTYSHGSVYNIVNRSKAPYGWKKDYDKYWYYSKLLGVNI